MKRVFILIAIVGMLCFLTNVWGGARFVTKVDYPSIAASSSESADLKLPSSVSRVVKIYGGMRGGQVGTFDVDIYANTAESAEDLIYTVDAISNLINDDTPVYLYSEHTSNVVALKLTNNASIARSMEITVITESMGSSSLTTD